MDVVSKIDFRESFHELKDVVHAGVVIFDVFVTKEVVDCVARELVFGFDIVSEANDDVHGDLRVIINYIAAFLDGGDQISVPDGSTVDGDVLRVVPLLIWEHEGD